MTEEERLADLLKRLDESHRMMTLAHFHAKPKPTLYSEAAAEIRRLLERA